MYRLLDVAWNHAIEMSHDPRTKVGACVINTNGDVLGLGSNRLDDGVEVTEERVTTKKGEWIRHAEVNALKNASTKGDAIVVTAMPCANCAQAIIDDGIKIVMIPNNSLFVDLYPHYREAASTDKWKDSWTKAREMFLANGVELVVVD